MPDEHTIEPNPIELMLLSFILRGAIASTAPYFEYLNFTDGQYRRDKYLHRRAKQGSERFAGYAPSTGDQ